MKNPIGGMIVFDPDFRFFLYVEFVKASTIYKRLYKFSAESDRLNAILELKADPDYIRHLECESEPF